MSEVKLFNRDTLEQKILDTMFHEQAIKQFEELGWLRDAPLVHMVHARNNDHKLVHADDWKLWEARGYYRDPTWVYHPAEGAKMVSAEQAKKLYSQGWFDTPAKFPGNQQGRKEAA